MKTVSARAELFLFLPPSATVTSEALLYFLLLKMCDRYKTWEKEAFAIAQNYCLILKDHHKIRNRSISDLTRPCLYYLKKVIMINSHKQDSHHP